ncbi:MAG: hypothetical protein U0M69_00725 [Lachnospiraceae bacterium]|nr:hypothetical protein [Lachnospiraceae bacterium]
MTLSEKDGQLFYKLWMPLLDYVNKKYKINKKLKNMPGAKVLDPQEVKEIANVLWENADIIDQYLAELGNLMPDEHREIIASWKNCISGTFAMERHLKKGTIFISLEDEKVYQVQGIISSWEEMFPYAPLPIVMQVTFIPFRDVIISDGLVMEYPIRIGGNMAKQFKDIYMREKKNGTIIRTLEESVIKDMQNNPWKKFSKLTEKCYMNMCGAVKDTSCWEQAFELLKEIVLEERKENQGFASTLEMLDDATDYNYDIQGWLEDCLDEVDMRGEYTTLLKMCDDLLTLFSWPEYSSSDIKFMKSTVLKQLGKTKEAVKFCEEWLKKEPENMVAAVAGVYTYIDTKEYEKAENLVDKFIIDKSECFEENDMMFTAASKLYGAMGKKKEKKQIDKAIKEYDEYLEDCFIGMDFDEDADEDWFDELPFN